MKNTFKFLFAVLIFSSCGGSDTITDSDENDTTAFVTDTTALDTIELVIEKPIIDVDLLLKKYTKTKSFPFKADSTYLTDLNEHSHKTLYGKEVVFLSQSMLKTDFSNSINHAIEDFILIDSLKEFNKYKGYVDTLEIGMTKEADAYVLDKLVLNDSTVILLWYLSTSTDNSYISGHGTYLLASILQGDKIISCAQLGEESGSGDAPYWVAKLITFTISNTGAKLTLIDSGSSEEDENGQEILDWSKEKLELVLIDNVWAVKK